ncbi:MAG: protein-disulfide reductase DsbD domain-containing protein [Candidatus Acidiferrales bacterium]
MSSVRVFACCVAFLCVMAAGVAISRASLAAAVAPAQESAAVPSAASIVKAHSFVSMEPVPRGKEFQVAVVAEIRSGYHVNSHKPSDEYLIATTLTPQLPEGFKLVDTIYPAGRQQKFSFSPDKPLDVYTGSVTFKLRLVAEAGAAIGAVKIPAILRYQACNDTTCLPPVKIPVELNVNVGAADTNGRALHPEIFAGAAK